MKKNLLVVLAVLVILSSVFAAADTTTLRPDAKGKWLQWKHIGCSGGAQEWGCVSEEVVNTGDYLKNDKSMKETFKFSDTGLTDEDVSGLTLYFYAMELDDSSNSCFEAMLRSDETDYFSGQQICVGSSWELVSQGYATNPATGNAWTVAELDDLEAGIRGLNPDDGAKLAQVYAVVDYGATDVCGNDIIEADEVCDGSDLDGESCTSFGFDGGTLSCVSDCGDFDTNSCFTNTCADSDGGDMPFNYGTASGDASGVPYSNADVCINGTHLTEWTCSGVSPVAVTVDCATRTNFPVICDSGICLELG